MKNSKYTAILIVFVIFIVLAIILRNFVIGYKFGVDYNFDEVVKEANLDVYAISIQTGEKVLISNNEDIQRIVEILENSTVKNTIPENTYIGGSIKLCIENKESGEQINISIHPKQITTEGKVLLFTKEYEQNTYDVVEEIVRKYISDEDMYKFKQ